MISEVLTFPFSSKMCLFSLQQAVRKQTQVAVDQHTHQYMCICVYVYINNLYLK